MAVTKLLHQLPAGSVRQSQVAEDDIEVLRCRELQRCRYAAGGLDLVIQCAQQLRQELPRILIILDEQNAQVSTDAAMGVAVYRNGFASGRRRQFDGEGRAL